MLSRLHQNVRRDASRERPIRNLLRLRFDQVEGVIYDRHDPFWQAGPVLGSYPRWRSKRMYKPYVHLAINDKSHCLGRSDGECFLGLCPECYDAS